LCFVILTTYARTHSFGVSVSPQIVLDVSANTVFAC
jgi:hypothetical protein